MMRDGAQRQSYLSVDDIGSAHTASLGLLLPVGKFDIQQHTQLLRYTHYSAKLYTAVAQQNLLVPPGQPSFLYD